MKTAMKKLSSVFMALAMIVSLSPMTGAMVLADETEETTPAATSTETEAPKEKHHHEKKKVKETEKKVTEETAETSKETEAKPAETKKETEATTAETTKETAAETTKESKETTAETTKEPEETTAEPSKETEETAVETTKEPEESEAEPSKETEESAAETTTETEPEETVPSESETPAETETPEETEAPQETEEKLPEEPVAKDPKNNNIGAINAKITDGVLTWDAYPDADWYDIEIDNNVWADYDSDEEGRVCDLKKQIDAFIASADLEKAGSYKITLRAYSEGMDSEHIATWTGTLVYDSSVSYPTLKAITVVENNGVITWNQIKNATDYVVVLGGYRFFKDSDDREFWLNDQIDWMIMAKYINKASSYRIRILAYNDNHKPLAEKAWDYGYSSAMNPMGNNKIAGINVENGILSWDDFDGTTEYEVNVEGSDDSLCVGETTLDINDYLDELLRWDENFTESNQYKIRVSAVSWSPEGGESTVIAESTYTYDFQIASNPLSVKGRTVKVKKKKIRKKKQVLSVNKVIAGISSGRGNFVFTKLSGPKKVLVNRRTGAITIKKKGLKKKKTYKIKVKVQAMGNYGYSPSEPKVVIIRIKVK